jgi:hypothetical protein
MGRTASYALRTAVALLAGALVSGALGLGLAGPALAQAPTSPEGLYGAQDPTYDGAYRQGLALVALAIAGVEDPAGAQWLREQQCPDGGWVAYREDPTAACPATDLSAFSGEDSNSTAMAVIALTASGVQLDHDPRPFLQGLQNADGGFGYLDGLPSDANSTALALNAIIALDDSPTAPEWTQAGGNPRSALLAMQLGCTADEADRGAWEYQPGQGPNVLATAQAVPAAAGRAYFLGPDGPVADDEPAFDCSGTPTPPDADTAADLGAGWLARQVNDDGFVAGPGGPNYSLTSYAVIALQSAGVGGNAHEAALAYLAAHVDAAVQDSEGRDQPGPLALLILGAVGADLDPTDFGVEDLLARLQATQRLQAASEEPSEEPSDDPSVEPTVVATPVDAVGGPLPDVAPTLVETGGFGTKPWDEVGVAVLGLGLVGYGLLFLAGAQLLTRHRARHLKS